MTRRMPGNHYTGIILVRNGPETVYMWFLPLVFLNFVFEGDFFFFASVDISPEEYDVWIMADW